MEDKTTNLFWTGGWDSTFRLLQSLIIHRNTVRPHYIIDIERKSLRHELMAMKMIKKSLFRDFPFTKELLLPMNLSIKSEIDKCENISNAFSQMIKIMPMGSQYEWLSAYCHSNNIFNMELSVEDHTGGDRFEFMKKHLQKIERNGEKLYVINEEFNETEFYQVFKFFFWPIMDFSRGMMIDIAREFKFEHLLYKTWFCHSPLKNNTPCGVCTPCIQVYEEGDKKRLPKQARRRYHFRNFLNSKNFKNEYPKLHSFAKKIKS